MTSLSPLVEHLNPGHKISPSEVGSNTELATLRKKPTGEVVSLASYAADARIKPDGQRQSLGDRFDLRQPTRGARTTLGNINRMGIIVLTGILQALDNKR